MNIQDIVLLSFLHHFYVIAHTPQECLREKYTTLSEIGTGDYKQCLGPKKSYQVQTGILEDPSQLSTILCTFLQISKYLHQPIVVLTDVEHSIYMYSYLQVPYEQYFDLHVLDLQSDAKMLKEMLYLKATSHKFLLVLCHLRCTLAILRQSLITEMLDRSFYWIILEPDVTTFQGELPETIISIEFDEVNAGNNTHSINDSRLSCNGFQMTLSKKDEFVITSENRQINLPHLYQRQEPKWSLMTHINDNEWYVDFRHIKYGYSNPPSRIKTVVIIEPPFTEFAVIVPDVNGLADCSIGKLCYVFEQVNETRRKVSRCCQGHSIDFILYLEKDLNIISDIYLVEDNIYGNEKPDGSWNGMVGDLVSGKAELLVGAITIFEKRSKVIDFTEPYMLSGVGIVAVARFIRPPFVNVNIFSSISWKLWLTLVGLVVSCAILLYCISLLQNKDRGYLHDYSVHEAMLYLSGVMFAKDMGGKDPESLGGRVISISFAILMLIIMSSLTAVLTANRVTHVVDLPITGFNDEKITNPTPAFQYATRAESGSYERFGESKNKDWNIMYEFMRPYNFIDSLKAVEDLKSGILGAIVNDIATLNYYTTLERDCKLKIVGSLIEDAGYGLATRKGSSLSKKLNSLVRKYREDGTLLRLEEKWFPQQCVEVYRDQEAASLYTFSGLFLMILICGIFSLIAFAIEKVMDWKIQRDLKGRRSFVIKQTIIVHQKEDHNSD